MGATRTQYIDSGVTARSSLNVGIAISIQRGSYNAPAAANFCGMATIPAIVSALRITNGGKYVKWGNESVTTYESSGVPAWGDTVYRVENSKQGYYIDGVLRHQWKDAGDWEGSGTISFFRAQPDDSLLHMPNECRVYDAFIKDNGVYIRKFVPAIDTEGVPCMYDTATKQAFYNIGTGKFIAGVDTLAQLRSLLANLPDKNDQDVAEPLQIRLAENLQTDELRALIDERAEAKNWEITEAPE